MTLNVDREWCQTSLGSALLHPEGEGGGGGGGLENHDADFELQRLSVEYNLHARGSGDTQLNTGRIGPKILKTLGVTSQQYLRHRSLRSARTQQARHADTMMSANSESASVIPRTHTRSATSSSAGGSSSNVTLSSLSSNEAFFGECTLLPEWRVRMHGKMAAGKSAITKALCGRIDDCPYSETPGLEICSVVIPVKVCVCVCSGSTVTM